MADDVKTPAKSASVTADGTSVLDVPTKRIHTVIGICGKERSGKDTLARFIVNHSYIPFVQKSFDTKLRECVQVFTNGDVSQYNMELDTHKAVRVDLGDLDDVVGRLQRTFSWLESLTKELNKDEWMAAARDVITPNRSYTVGQLLEIIIRLFGKNVWVEAVHNEWIKEGCPPMVLRDIHGTFELAYIKSLGGKLIHVDAGKRLALEVCATAVAPITTAVVTIPVTASDLAAADSRSTTHSSETSINYTDASTFDCVVDNNGTMDEYVKLLMSHSQLKWLAAIRPEAERCKVYLCGPMVGLPNKNRDAFDTAEQKLRDDGWVVVNPHNLNLLDECFEEMYVSRLSECRFIYLLPGWKTSPVAVTTTKVATILGIKHLN